MFITYKIYNTLVRLPKELELDLETINCNQVDFTLAPKNRNLNLSSDDINWYHHWINKNNFPWLSAGITRNNDYILRFNDIDFFISPSGTEIFYDESRNASKSEIIHKFFNQVLPMTMNSLGKEIIHASSILISDEAIAFVGNGGYGKSTIATSLIKEGHKLISDDVVPLISNDRDIYTASGLNTINLWPRAQKILNRSISSNFPGKSYVALSKKEHSTGNFPLKKIYFLKPLQDIKTVSINKLPRQEAVIELVRAAHRLDITNKQMLQNQLNRLTEISGLLSCNMLSFPADIPEPKLIASFILSDLRNVTHAI